VNRPWDDLGHLEDHVVAVADDHRVDLGHLLAQLIYRSTLSLGRTCGLLLGLDSVLTAPDKECPVFIQIETLVYGTPQTID
jgi:hypothetical protein